MNNIFHKNTKALTADCEAQKIRCRAHGRKGIFVPTKYTSNIVCLLKIIFTTNPFAHGHGLYYYGFVRRGLCSILHDDYELG